MLFRLLEVKESMVTEVVYIILVNCGLRNRVIPFFNANTIQTVFQFARTSEFLTCQFSFNTFMRVCVPGKYAVVLLATVLNLS
jgi:hypothetical protein